MASQNCTFSNFSQQLYFSYFFVYILKFVYLFLRKHQVVYTKSRVLISFGGSPGQAFAQNCHFSAKNLEGCQSATIVQEDESCFKVCLLFWGGGQLFVYIFYLLILCNCLHKACKNTGEATWQGKCTQD